MVEHGSPDRNWSHKMLSLQQALRNIADQYHIADLLVFGSRASEIAGRVRSGSAVTLRAASDVDVGVRSQAGHSLRLRDKARLAAALEDLLDVGRVDLVSLENADPFLAADIIRGERLFARDDLEADEYELYVLRRAGDLVPFERERIAMILGEGR
jgi:predicted nucleotidyltransferase